MHRLLALRIFVEECSTIFQSYYDFCGDLVSGDITARLKESVFGKPELQNSTCDFDRRQADSLSNNATEKN